MNPDNFYLQAMANKFMDPYIQSEDLPQWKEIRDGLYLPFSGPGNDANLSWLSYEKLIFKFLPMEYKEKAFHNLNQKDSVTTREILLPYLIQNVSDPGYRLNTPMQTIYFIGMDYDIWSHDDVVFCFGLNMLELCKKRAEDHLKGGPPVWDPKTQSFDLKFYQINSNGATYRIDLTVTNRSSPI